MDGEELRNRPRNIKLLVHYDGTDLHGFQRQKGQVSVQEALETAIRAVTGEEPRLAAAGRTDAGVHAVGQVVNFHTASRLGLDRVPYALNAHLPPSIVVQQAEDVPPDFHARFSALSKAYRYTILNAPFPAPRVSRYAYLWREPLDVEAIGRAAGHLVGRHDFAAFRATGSSAKTTVRTIFDCRVLEEPLEGAPVGRLLHIWVEADGFLYNMVRIIAGTLLDVGGGRRSADELPAILTSGERDQAGRTLPPQGLCLMRINYASSVLDGEPKIP